MGIKFTDAYIDNIARAHLEPGEQIVARSAGVHRPFWTLGFIWFWKTYLVLATDRRIILAEHRRGLFYDRLERVDAVPYSGVATAKVSGLLLKKKLKLAFQDGRSALALVLPGFPGPIARAKAGAKDVVAPWEQGKALPAPAAAPAAPAAFGAPAF